MGFAVLETSEVPRKLMHLCCLTNPEGKYLGYPICAMHISSFVIPATFKDWDREYYMPMAATSSRIHRLEDTFIQSKEVNEWLKGWEV